MTLPLVIVTEPALMPNVCGRCGADPRVRDYYIDTGIDFYMIDVGTMYGRLYICNMCFRDFVTIDPDSLSKTDVDEMITQLTSSVAFANKVKEDWLNKVEAFKKLGIDLEKVWEEIGSTSPAVLASNAEPDGPTGTDEPDGVRIDSPEPIVNPLFAEPISIFGA